MITPMTLITTTRMPEGQEMNGKIEQQSLETPVDNEVEEERGLSSKSYKQQTSLLRLEVDVEVIKTTAGEASQLPVISGDQSNQRNATTKRQKHDSITLSSLPCLVIDDENNTREELSPPLFESSTENNNRFLTKTHPPLDSVVVEENSAVQSLSVDQNIVCHKDDVVFVGQTANQDKNHERRTSQTCQENNNNNPLAKTSILPEQEHSGHSTASSSINESKSLNNNNKSTSLPVLNFIHDILLLSSKQDCCLVCHYLNTSSIYALDEHHIKMQEEKECLVVKSVGSSHDTQVTVFNNGYGSTKTTTNNQRCTLFFDATHFPERSTLFDHDNLRRSNVRRAMSLSSSYPDHRLHTGRTRKLLCPRQPPTQMQRTLSISRTNVSKRDNSRLSSNQKWILLCLSLVSFTSFLCMSIMAPFFPKVAAEKGMSGTVSGFVFSVYAFVVMIASPILGHFLPKVGAKFMLISGIFAAGVASILFGFLNQLNSTLQFTIYCFVVRSVEALGAAAFSTASYTYIMYAFPDDIGTAFGLTETCVGVGMSLGPAIGSGLFSIGGYGLPFYTLGSFILLNIPLCFFIIEPIDHSLERPVKGDDIDGQDDTTSQECVKTSYFSLISIPQVAVISLVVVVVSQSQGFLDPTVEPHFRHQYDLGTGFVGIVFLLMSFAYAILSPITGWFATKMDNKYPLMIIGLLLSAVGLVLLGPSWFIPLSPNPWISTTSMVVMGFAYAIAFIPTFECILDLAVEKGFADNVKTYSLVSGLWSSMYSLGEVSGPLFGGLFVDVFDFRHGVTVMAAFSLIAV